MLELIQEIFLLFLPLLLTLCAVFAVLAGAHWLLIKRNTGIGTEKLFPRQIAMLVLTLIAAVAITLSLPIEEESRTQIIQLIGLLVSGVLAFASTNIFANLAAGILLRVTKPFSIGDYITVSDHFGQVSARGLYDTEIQSDNGELIALPNTYVISNPVSNMRSAKRILSVTVALGYDVHHDVIEPLLIAAAKKVGLIDSFVHVIELGDYNITYRVSGVLPEEKGYLTARSGLNKALLDELHQNNIEVMCPSFMNQRPLEKGQLVIPKPTVKKVKKQSSDNDAEEILFEKAKQAKEFEEEKKRLSEEIKALAEAIKAAESNDDKETMRKQQVAKQEQLAELSKQAESHKAR